VSTNFLHLQRYDEQLYRLGVLKALLKLRQLGELLAQQAASRFGTDLRVEETQQQLVQRLGLEGLLDPEVVELFHVLRRKGNLANHELQGDHATALKTLRIAWQLGVWFHRTFSDPEFRSGPFVPPSPPEVADQALQVELEGLARLAELQAAARREDPAVREARRQASRRAADHLELNEAQTRDQIDEQLRQAGWEADSRTLLAIAEWPTRSGPADYVLFAGLTPLAAVEAKRAHKDVAGVLPQAERFYRDLLSSPETVLPPAGEGDGSGCIPFALATNGRPFLRQLQTPKPSTGWCAKPWRRNSIRCERRRP